MKKEIIHCDICGMEIPQSDEGYDSFTFEINITAGYDGYPQILRKKYKEICGLCHSVTRIFANEIIEKLKKIDKNY